MRYRCRHMPRPTAEQARIIRSGLTMGGITSLPVNHNYIAERHEFELLDRMEALGFVEYQRSVLAYRVYGITGRGATAVGLYLMKMEDIPFGWNTM
jgi:hypothetical protein